MTNREEGGGLVLPSGTCGGATAGVGGGGGGLGGTRTYAAHCSLPFSLGGCQNTTARGAEGGGACGGVCDRSESGVRRTPCSLWAPEGHRQSTAAAPTDRQAPVVPPMTPFLTCLTC